MHEQICLPFAFNYLYKWKLDSICVYVLNAHRRHFSVLRVPTAAEIKCIVLENLWSYRTQINLVGIHSNQF